MNNQPNFQKLRTDRSALVYFLRAGLSLGLLMWVDDRAMAKDLDTIAYPYQGKHAIKSGIGHARNRALMNAELKRRGIDYVVKGGLFSVHTPIVAMNLLCADYNINH